MLLLLQYTLIFSSVLLLVALGGCFSEHSGVINLGLAGIMAARDAAEEKYEASGAQPVVKHTNQGGNTNIVKNPVLVLVMELQAQALAYWRDLGLTPAGLKRIDEKAVKAQKKNTMAEAFKNIGI